MVCSEGADTLSVAIVCNSKRTWRGKSASVKMVRKLE
jgi:hypothetical protein